MAVFAVGLGAIGCQVIVASRANGVSSRVLEANASIERGSYAEAVVLLEDAVRQRPRSLELHGLLAEALEGLGFRAAALAHYEFCARQNPGSASALWTLATAYVRAGNHRDAIRALEQYARSHRLEKPFLRLLSYCYRKVGAAGQARRTRLRADTMRDGETGLAAPPDGPLELCQYM